MCGHQFFGAGNKTARRIAWLVTARENVLRERASGARVGDNARRLPCFKFLVVLLQHFRRETKAIKPAAVRFEVVITIAQTVAIDRIEIVSPEERGAHAARNADAAHRILDGAFAPAVLFRSEPDFGGRSG